MPETSRERSSSKNPVAPKVLENVHLRFILVLQHLATQYYSSVKISVFISGSAWRKVLGNVNHAKRRQQSLSRTQFDIRGRHI